MKAADDACLTTNSRRDEMVTPFGVDLKRQCRIDLVDPRFLSRVTRADIQNRRARSELVDIYAVGAPLPPEAFFVHPRLVTRAPPLIVRKLVSRHQPLANDPRLCIVHVQRSLTPFVIVAPLVDCVRQCAVGLLYGSPGTRPHRKYLSSSIAPPSRRMNSRDTRS